MPLTSRQLYLSERQRRQNKIFALITVGMGIALAVSLIVLSGLISLPFGDGFSTKVSYAAPGDIPCPTEGAKPSDPASVQVQVLNGTNRAGIAGSATDILRSVGFQAEDPQNAGQDYPGVVEISAGPRGVDDAWTVARLFPNSRVTLTAATDKRVLITLGSFYDRPIEADEATRASRNTDPLERPQKCFPVDPDSILDAGEASSQVEQSDQSAPESEGGESSN